MSKWNKRMLNIAQEVASWSKDPDHKVGAVLASIDNRILSTGYNGLPAGMERLPIDKQEKLFKTIHAEVNCLIQAQGVPSCTTMYITRYPCAQCAALIIQTKVARVVCPIREVKSTWSESMIAAEELFKQSFIRVDFI